MGAADGVAVELPRCDTVAKATGVLRPVLAPLGKAGERFHEMLHCLTGEKVAAEMLAGDWVPTWYGWCEMLEFAGDVASQFCQLQALVLRFLRVAEANTPVTALRTDEDRVRELEE